MHPRRFSLECDRAGFLHTKTSLCLGRDEHKRVHALALTSAIARIAAAGFVVLRQSTRLRLQVAGLQVVYSLALLGSIKSWS